MYMYEKSYNVKKGAGNDKSTVYSVQNGPNTGKDQSKSNLKKDVGYTLTTTP